MKQGAFLLVTSSIFALIALVHALRLFYGWKVTIGNWAVPVWVSTLGFLIAGYLACQGVPVQEKTAVTGRPIALLVVLGFSVLLAAPLAAEVLMDCRSFTDSRG